MALLNLITAFANLALGLVVYTKSGNRHLKTSFLLFTIFIAGWLFSNYYFEAIRESLFVLKSQYSLGGLVLVSAFPWTLYFIDEKPNRATLSLFGLLGVIILIVPYLDGLLIKGLSTSGVGNFGYQSGPLFNLYSFFMLLLVCLIIYKLVSAYKKSKGMKKSQILYTLYGVLIFSITTITFATILPLFNIKPVVAYDAQSSIFWVAFTAYAIITYQLFDIRVIIRKTVEYSGLLAFALGVYSLIIFLTTALFGITNSFTANLFASVLIAFGFDPIKKYLTKVTDKYLFKGEYDPQEVLAELSKELSASLDLRQATQSLVMLMKIQLRLTHTAVIVFTTEESRVVIKEAVQDGYPDPSILQLRPENLLLQQCAREPQVIITENLKRDCEERATSDLDAEACRLLLVDLEKLQAAIILPILVDKKAIGMFLVGDKLSGDTYTKEEIEFLTIVASQTANTIEKTRFWEEDQMKSEFVSIASHELLTPTAAMKGYLSMILDDNMGQIDDTARKFLTKVSLSADRLALLVEDLLNVSRIESGRLKINKRDFSLAESAQRATDELQVNAKKKSLDVAFVPSQTAMPNVNADPDHIYRVLVNLIGNAIKYTPAGWVRCFVSQYSATHVLFSVSDSGLGIPKESIPHLFEKFNRADRKEIAGIQGTGLGLYISKKIIDLMGGQMWVESEVGKGTTFYFTLPISTATIVSTSVVNAAPQPQAVVQK